MPLVLPVLSLSLVMSLCVCVCVCVFVCVMQEPSQLSKLPLWDEAVSREEPIGLEEWQDFLDSEGRVVRENDFRRRLFKGVCISSCAFFRSPSLPFGWKVSFSNYEKGP